jgi:PTH1 family peptidyl-tRNA hydrolase
MTGEPYLVVGLGNPGPGYAGNRHNVGAMVVDLLAERVRGRFKPHGGLRRRGGAGGGAEVVEDRLDGRRVVLAKPRSYMNESGGPVAALTRYFDIPPERLVVVHDELDVPYGALRLKLGGGDNGHNGLRSVRRSLGTGDFLRVRVGIGRPPGRQDPADYVLRDFSAAERKDLAWVLDRAADAAVVLVSDGLEAAQNGFND